MMNNSLKFIPVVYVLFRHSYYYIQPLGKWDPPGSGGEGCWVSMTLPVNLK